MKLQKLLFLLLSLILLGSCASGYRPINPKELNYVSNNNTSGVKLEYKYDLLNKKYAKKEVKKGIKVIAVKITNDTDQDLVFGKDIKLKYENGNDVYVLKNEIVFKSMKQSIPSYLFYMLLTPLNFYTADNNGSSSSTPIGLVLGPLLTGSNMIAAGSANKKFKKELLAYDINGTVIKKGETTYGLIGVKSSSYDAIKVILE